MQVRTCYRRWKNDNGQWVVDIDGDCRECYSEEDAILIAGGLLLDGSHNRELLQRTLEANLRNGIDHGYWVTRLLTSALDSAGRNER
jgi:hypothetical protein